MPSSNSLLLSPTLSSEKTDFDLGPSAASPAEEVPVVEPTSAAEGFPRSLSTPSFVGGASEDAHRVEILQQWRGYVLERKRDCFIAILEDLTNPGKADERAEIALEELSDSDLQLVEEGALFELVIGVRRTGAERQRFSYIRFRRLPRWTASEFQRVAEKAEAFGRRLERQEKEANTAGA
jgi:hypothetical protein